MSDKRQTAMRRCCCSDCCCCGCTKASSLASLMIWT